ncbi:endo-1,4-beta-xylanase [Altericista sp. CCNU0014]|uniref:endo-1,4-beta-xylanase n=1 Tax=Altericista sp. CCNU0014 TaxID=3082949 RepID=UPI00384B1847
MDRRKVLKLSGGLGLGYLLARQNVSQAEAVKPRLKMVAYLPDGNPLPRQPLNQLYFLDLQDEPLPSPPRKVEDGVLVSEPPAVIPFAIALKLPVEGFGEVTLYADNDGRGFGPADFPLNLNLAFAQTRLQRVQNALRHWRSQGFSFSDGIEQRLGRAKGGVRVAIATHPESAKRPESNATSLQAKIKACNASLAESLWAGEELVFAKARQIVQKLPRSRTMRLGCNAFGYPQAGPDYERYFRQIFNFATIPFYWKPFEPEPGRTQFADRDRTADWLRDSGIAVKGHPLAWFHEIGIPDWVRQKPYAELKTLLRQRAIDITAHYQNRISYFDVINEAHGAPWANELRFTPEQFLDLTRLTAEAARQGNPAVQRILNCCCLWGETVPYYPPPQRSPYQYLKAALSARIPFEIVGLQLYYPDQDLFEIDRLLERFSALGKPIHITELGVSSATGIDEQSYLKDARGLWHKPWSQTIQADWIEQFYTICYSKPAIEAISWWDFSDRGCFWPFGGLLDRNMQPKESFYRLKTLLAQWRYR